MTYQCWMGSEDSLRSLISLEQEIADLRKAAVTGSADRQAFMFLFDEEEEDDKPLGSHLIEKVGEVGIIKISGSLTNAHSGWHVFMAGRITSYEAIGGAVDLLLEDREVSKIALKISSGGGAVTGIDSIAQKIRRADTQKPVIAHTSTHAFSAAYWLAASAREIVATRMAELGSIGTLMVHQSVHRMAKDAGIDITVFRAGKYKAVGHPMESLSDEVKEYLQADIDKANSFFLEHVSMRRNLMVSNKAVWAEGKTFFAGEAQSVGLVDRVGDLEDILVSASGAAYHKRSMEMNISAEKLAQIEAGANPEDVLSEQELKDYKAAIAAEDPGTGTGNDETPTPEGGEADDEPPNTPAAEDKGTGYGEGISASDYREAVKEAARAEARAETLQDKLEAAEAKLATNESTTGALLAIATDALNKRQVALGKPATEPKNAEALVNAYHELSSELSRRFKVGQQSQEMDTSEEASKTSSGIPLTLKRNKGA